jgi:hypothetical protein
MHFKREKVLKSFQVILTLWIKKNMGPLHSQNLRAGDQVNFMGRI